MDMITLAMAKKYSDSKGGYTKSSAPFELIPETQATASGEFLASAIPEAGDEIILFIDGVKHVRTAIGGSVDDMPVVYIGNCAEAGLPETTDDFGVMFLSAGDVRVFVVMDSGYFEGKDTFTISATAITKIIVPIDPKYLPGVCLPVVELETEISGESAETFLSAADTVKMNALNGEACILKFDFSLMGSVATIRKVVGSFGFGSMFAYDVSLGPLGNLTFNNETDDGTWKCARG